MKNFCQRLFIILFDKMGTLTVFITCGSLCCFKGNKNKVICKVTQDWYSNDFQTTTNGNKNTLPQCLQEVVCCQLGCHFGQGTSWNNKTLTKYMLPISTKVGNTYKFQTITATHIWISRQRHYFACKFKPSQSSSHLPNSNLKF